METVTIEVDSDLLEQVKELIKPYGITPEQLIEQFFRWCAECPEEATQYLKAAMLEQSNT